MRPVGSRDLQGLFQASSTLAEPFGAPKQPSLRCERREERLANNGPCCASLRLFRLCGAVPDAAKLEGTQARKSLASSVGALAARFAPCRKPTVVLLNFLDCASNGLDGKEAQQHAAE